MAMNPDANKMEELRQAILAGDKDGEFVGVDKAVPGTDASVLAVPARMLGIKDGQVDLRPGAMAISQLLRPNGQPVPEHWSTYKTGEEVVVKGYRWVIAHLGEKHLLLEPLGPVLVGEEDGESHG